MPKARTKRSAVREERKRKRQAEQEDNYHAKRSRKEREEDGGEGPWEEPAQLSFEAPEELEFFGMLSDEEKEYFRRADEMLELNQFQANEDRDIFIESVWREADGKELKLACSQSCSRLTERLIQISTTKQKKRLFEAFAGHFLTLVQHRFASHCCEALFLKSAGVVTQELAGFQSFVLDTSGAGTDGQQPQPEMSMEDLILATLDELEGNLSYLITERFASHALRVLMLVLSGRPLEDAAARTLMKSKRKENISVAGGAVADEQNQGLRAVPQSFTMAVQKITRDSVSSMDKTSLRVLAKHPVGNPTLQLFLELDLELGKQDQKGEPAKSTLLDQLLPGAPKSLSDEKSEAYGFITGMIYDPIGSRIVETIVTRCPGKVFKAINTIVLPRIQDYARNDVSCYAAIKVLNRIGKDDLVKAVEQIVPTVPQLVERAKFNVIKALFERSTARGLSEEIKKLMRGLREGCGSQPEDLILAPCCLKDEEKRKKDISQVGKNTYAIQSHGAQLLTTLLSIPGPSKGVQEAILALSPEVLVRLAKISLPTVTVLTTALNTPSNNPAFHKTIVNTITPHTADLATSQFGHNLLNAIPEVPSKGKERSVPFHMKEAIMTRLAENESLLRESNWMGRSVWKKWKGDMWKTRRGDWKMHLNENKT